MALDEPQIVRFSRQILLKEIGGRGQERLLAARFGLRGGGPALAIATSYLEAAGLTIGDGPALLVSLPIGEIPTAACVALGGTGSSGRLVYAGDQTCRACLALNLGDLEAPPDELAAVVGTAAAIAAQRLILGLGAAAGTATLQPDGTVEEAGWKRCITCG